jgi:hypothetical protein
MFMLVAKMDTTVVALLVRVGAVQHCFHHLVAEQLIFE